MREESVMSSGSYDRYFTQLPKYFFVTGGTALSPVSTLNAFDEALMKAGIAQCNLVPVSSILPADAVEVEYLRRSSRRTSPRRS